MKTNRAQFELLNKILSETATDERAALQSSINKLTDNGLQLYLDLQGKMDVSQQELVTRAEFGDINKYTLQQTVDYYESQKISDELGGSKYKRLLSTPKHKNKIIQAIDNKLKYQQELDALDAANAKIKTDPSAALQELQPLQEKLAYENFIQRLLDLGLNALKNKLAKLDPADQKRFLQNFEHADDALLNVMNDSKKTLFADWQSGKKTGAPVGFDRYYYESSDAFEHADIGDFTGPTDPNSSLEPGRMKGGGHGEKNKRYLDALKWKYEVNYTFTNKVTVGNILKHSDLNKRTGNGQSWFPVGWTEIDIRNAGNFVKDNNKVAFGLLSGDTPLFDEYRGVRVGVIKTNGDIGTVFPDLNQQPLGNGQNEIR